MTTPRSYERSIFRISRRQVDSPLGDTVISNEPDYVSLKTALILHLGEISNSLNRYDLKSGSKLMTYSSNDGAAIDLEINSSGLEFRVSLGGLPRVVESIERSIKDVVEQNDVGRIFVVEEDTGEDW